MAGKLAGRRAYVTGGSSGIGAAVVAALAAEGADVAIGASKRSGQAEAAAAKLTAEDGAPSSSRPISPTGRKPIALPIRC